MDRPVLWGSTPENPDSPLSGYPSPVLTDRRATGIPVIQDILTGDARRAGILSASRINQGELP